MGTLAVDNIQHTDGSSAVTLNNANINITTGTFPAGHVLQVLSTSKVDVFTTQEQSYTDITGFSVDITPSSTSSKILILASCQFGSSSGGGYPSFRMVRDSTVINAGTAEGNRHPGVVTMNIYNADSGSGAMMNTHFLDSPASTSSLTYKMQGQHSGAAILIVGGGGNNPNSTWATRSASTITVMEIVG